MGTFDEHAGKPVILEQGQRLSRCSLWEWQRRFYEAQGTAAFSSGTVPSQITTAPAIAAAYARVLHGLLRDCRHSGSPQAPLYVVELGAGTGRLAYRLLRKLEALEQIAPSGGPPLRYVLTDVAESNVREAMAHPLLQPLVASGRLDFAVREAYARGPLTLLGSGEQLTPESLHHPLVVIGNYLFDSLEQDFFQVREGVLHEGLARLSTPPYLRVDRESPLLLAAVQLDFDYRPVEGNAYPVPAWNTLLEHYRQRLAGATFPFPVGALRCLEHLAELARGRLLVLAADKGYLYESELRALTEPSFARHGGCLSFMFNFHAVGAWVESQGGFWLQGTEERSRLGVAAFLLGAPPSERTGTRLAFHEALAALPPMERLVLVRAATGDDYALTLDIALAALRLSEWDPELIFILHKPLLRIAEDLAPGRREPLLRALERVWSQQYPLVPKDDLAPWLAPLLRALGHPALAVDYLRQSLAWLGERGGTLYELALCLEALQQRTEALEALERALALEPGHAQARAARERLAALP